MNTPFGMVGAALLFWGWQTGWVPLALPLALALEARVIWRPAYVLDAAGINRFADLSSLALIAVGAWFLVTIEGPRAARTVLGMAQALPLALAPLALAQAYLVREPLDLSVLFVTLRKRPVSGIRVDFGFVYVIACVLAAATANVRDEMFYAGATVFTAWSLWNLRSRRYSRLAPFAMLVAASVMGYAGHVGLNQLQGVLTSWLGEFIDRSAYTDPYRARTDIGSIGKLKESDRVVLRVRLPQGQDTPLLLHRSSYNVFVSPTWVARAAKFEALPGDPAKGWALGDASGARTRPARAPAAQDNIEVLEYLRDGRTLLSLPANTAHLNGLPPAELQRSRLGSVSVETAPGFIRYRAQRRPELADEGAPDATDYEVPGREREAISAIAAKLGLRGLNPAEARRRVERFFLENFRYTTWLEAANPNAPTPLAEFLTRTRAGHCEYFASATTLLLREAGIAARYATGFSVQEKSYGDDYLVRERHAHAWTRAWMGGAWVDIDTTPPQWFAIESENAGAWETLVDAWSWLRFAWGRFQTADETSPRPLLLGLVGALFAGLAWSILRRPSRKMARRAGATPSSAPARGADSEFYRIEELLATRGLGRHSSEPVSAWLARIERSGLAAGAVAATRADDAAQMTELRTIAALHYRLRFDPAPMGDGQRTELRLRSERWLQTAQAVEVS